MILNSGVTESNNGTYNIFDKERGLAVLRGILSRGNCQRGGGGRMRDTDNDGGSLSIPRSHVVLYECMHHVLSPHRVLEGDLSFDPAIINHCSNRLICVPRF